jgi:hypothetical protein
MLACRLGIPAEKNKQTTNQKEMQYEAHWR